ncbi:MAG: nucleotidyltransferase [Tissierellia bacterium]|nr:nucleotidyltransferase [Tissierellia bacterium]MDD3225963.1 nucleotidyltransferase [Tissierellia bacterium]MDD3751450.1 nucleotidyltransferase [Tissierellia bacterium]MDD4046053.1 nucleotidyltransferase [Tissierellia bacterium]MDD4677577.1 nucleotidyltransferase [Tissierellia bacterium]
MKITGVVAEYNPFHAGHEYQLKMAKRLSGCDCIAVVMSGNYVQRGEPAIIDKFKRAEAAIYGGADIVIELPMPFSCQNAEMFALAAMIELSKLHIDSISFGCENDDVELLEKIALIQLTPGFNSYIKKEMKKGLSYPNAMSNALKSVLNDEAEAVYSPNNVLAVEYIKSAMKLNLNLQYYPVKRVGMAHNDNEITGSFYSASAIRNSLMEGSFENLKLTEKSVELIEKFYKEQKKYNTLNNYSDYLYYKIITCDDLEKIYEIKEGLNNKIISQVYKHESIDELIMSLKSKRYTYSKLRRSLLNILLDIKKVDIINIMSTNNNYVKVLAFNNTGRKVIKNAGNNGTEVINRYSDYKKYNLTPEKLARFNITNKSSNIYYLPLKNRKMNSEYTENAVYVDI